MPVKKKSDVSAVCSEVSGIDIPDDVVACFIIDRRTNTSVVVSPFTVTITRGKDAYTMLVDEIVELSRRDKKVVLKTKAGDVLEVVLGGT